VESIAWDFLPTGLVWALLPSRLGRLADRFGRKPLMLLALGAAALSSLLIPALGTLAALAVVWAFQAVCYAAGDPAEQALVADLAGPSQRGRAYGLYVMCADLGAAIGPLGGAWLYQAYGAPAPFYANGLILALCALALALFLKLPRPRPAPPAPEHPAQV
jgi:MFS family permease